MNGTSTGRTTRERTVGGASWRRLLGAAMAAALTIVSTRGCSLFSGSAKASAERLCTPGANVFCRCADTTPGTKLCNDDAQTFGACRTNDDGACKGGEIQDPDTGKTVDENGNVVEGEGNDKLTTASALDACPGKPTAVGVGPEVVIDDDTTGAHDDLEGAGACAAGGGGPDHVYHLQPTGSGVLQVKVQGTGPLNPTVYLRTTCADDKSQIACGESTGAAGLEQLQANVTTGQDYFLVVDGASGSAGKYRVTLNLTTGSFCGDGKVDPNEACDDGNKTENDGCSNDCRRIDGDPPTGNGCPGQPVDLWPGQRVTGNASTLPYGNTFTKTGSSCLVSANNLNAGQDHVYAVTAHATGTLRVVLTPQPEANLMLVARTACDDANTQGPNMCANDGAAGATETMTFGVSKGQTAYVAVDGVLTARGSYAIELSLQ